MNRGGLLKSVNKNFLFARYQCLIVNYCFFVPLQRYNTNPQTVNDKKQGCFVFMSLCMYLCLFKNY